MSEQIKQDLRGAWPTLIALLMQSLILAFFLGTLSARVSALELTVARMVSCDRVDALDGRVDRIDGRVAHIERGEVPWRP